MTDADLVAASSLPTTEEEDRFWALVERSWDQVGPEPAVLRRALLDRNPDGEGDDDPYAIDEWLDAFIAAVRESCAGLSRPELVVLDRVIERKLYDIDRHDIQAVTDGSDDGFLYARGFIVAMGREFYEAVRANPAKAVLDAECEEICYLFAHLHKERFGSWPNTGSGITRESVSNPVGWPMD